MCHLDEREKYYFKLTNISDLPPKEKECDIAICCPICREGKSWNKKQRLHFYFDHYLKKPNVKCFNCGFSGSLKTYLKTVNMNLYEQYKTEIRKIYLEKLKNKSKQINEIKELNEKSGKKFKNEFILFDVPKEFVKIKGTPAEDYLAKRGLSQYTDLFYYCESNVKLKDKTLFIKNSIIIPLEKDGKLYGFQSRKLDKKEFYTFLPNHGLKVWNIFNVDWDKAVFIFESVFDALSSGLPLNRIVANLGISFPQDLLDKLEKPIFCLDNQNYDEASRNQSLKYIDDYYVFIWPKIYKGEPISAKDFNELIQNGWNKDMIKHLILDNIYKGFKGKLKLKLL